MNSNNSITINSETYDIVKTLGQGSFGKVYLVANSRTHIQYALKQQSAITEKELDVLQKFKSITFQNVVNTIEVVQIKKDWLILMEYCEQNLYEYLNEIKYFNDRDIRYVMQQITNGVKELHSYGLIHRDIKPENILRFSIQDKTTKKIQYTYKLCDLGLVTKEDQAKTAFVGTPYYLAPELLIQNQKYSQKVDIWALGVVMFELLTGNVIFNGRIVEEIYKAIKNDNPSKKILQIPNLDPKYQNLMISMLDRIPEKRPNITQVANELKSFFTIKANTQLGNQKENKPEYQKYPQQQSISAIRGDIPQNSNSQNISITRDITPQNPRSQITPIVRGITPMNPKPLIIPNVRDVTPQNPKPQIITNVRDVTPQNPKQLNIPNVRDVTPQNPKPQIITNVRDVTPQNPKPSIIPNVRDHTPQIPKPQPNQINRGITPIYQKSEINHTTNTRGVIPSIPKPQPIIQQTEQRQYRQLENPNKIVGGKTPMIIKKENETTRVVKNNDLQN